MADYRLTGPLEQMRGVIGREPGPGDRYIFEFDSVGERSVHMVGVRRPLEVTWIAEGEETFSTTLRPWVGYGSAPADVVIERAADHGGDQ